MGIGEQTSRARARAENADVARSGGDERREMIAISLVVGLIGGSIGALYPALRAARQDAVDALSYE